MKSGKVKPEQVSWGGIFGGYAFVVFHRINSMMYNTKKIAKSDLPPRLIDIKNPQYKGKYVVAPFPTMWQLATLVYPRDEMLTVVDQIGKNAGGVLTYNLGSQRVNLGEFAFMPLGLHLLSQIITKDPKAPVAAHYFADVVSLSHVSYSVPRGIPHPAAAFLFTMWMTPPEAEALWQPILGNPNVIYGDPGLLADQADPRVLSSPSRQEPRALVCRAIVHREHLEVLERLGAKRSDALRQVRRRVAHGK